MPMYINHFTCLPDAWPVDREGQIETWRAIVGDADTLVDDPGPVKFTGWINNSEGYTIIEADSKADVMRLCAEFWPPFHNDLTEVVPTPVAGPAILAGATEGWED